MSGGIEDTVSKEMGRAWGAQGSLAKPSLGNQAVVLPEAPLEGRLEDCGHESPHVQDDIAPDAPRSCAEGDLGVERGALRSQRDAGRL